jgi:DNA mismatch repair protein MLH1
MFYHSEQYFYQIALRQFGNFARIKLDPPPSIKLLIEMAVRAEKGIAEKSLDPAKIVKVGPPRFWA